MSLRPLSFRVVKQKLLAAGFLVEDQRGSHVKFSKKTGGGTRTVIVPDHRGDLKMGLLRSLIKSAGLTVDEFNDL